MILPVERGPSICSHAGEFWWLANSRGHFNDGQVLAAFANANLVAHIHLVRRNVHLAAIHFDVTMTNDLAGLTARAGIAHAKATLSRRRSSCCRSSSPVTPGVREAFS